MWSDAEPQQDQLDLSLVLSELDRALAAGKHVKLEINSGGAGTPAWVLPLVQTYTYLDPNVFHDTYGEPISIPLFWDPAFLQHKTELIAAMGSALSGHPALTVVASNCANGYTSDWFIPAYSDQDVQAWLDAGWSEDKLLAACKQVVDATMAAFPRQSVTMALGITPVALSSDPNYVAQQTVAYASTQYPGRFIAMRYNLSARTPDPRLTTALSSWQVIKDAPQAAAQMLWLAGDVTTCRMNGGISPCDAATMLLSASDIGVGGYGMKYLEIYGGDLTNTTLTSAVDTVAGWF